MKILVGTIYKDDAFFLCQNLPDSFEVYPESISKSHRSKGVFCKTKDVTFCSVAIACVDDEGYPL